MRNCKSRIEKTQCSKDRWNSMPKDVFVKIGIAGNFNQDNLNLISRRSCKVSIIYRIVYKTLICVYLYHTVADILNTDKIFK